MTRLVPITRINVGVGTGKFLTPDPSGRNSLDRFTLCIIVAGSLSPLVGAVTSESGRWVFARLASNTAGSGLGPWYLAKAKALSVGLSNAYFKSLGLPSLVEEC